MKKGAVSLTALIVLLIIALSVPPPAYSQGIFPQLNEGIERYKQENYTGAIEALKEARRQHPDLSIAAFFLGLSYKQTLNYQEAIGQFKDAVTLNPRIKDALVELVDVLYQSGNLDEAKKWIAIGEEEKIHPAKLAFLKGLVFQKEGNIEGSAAAFNRASELDPSLSQSSEFQIAIGYLKDHNLKLAKERFQASIQQNPTSDLASFARYYIDAVEKQIFTERPFRFTLGVFGQYDSNVVLKPTEQEVAPDITDEGSGVLSTSFRVDYTPVFQSPWLFNAQYSFISNFHDNHSTTHDMTGNTISLSPGYSFGTAAFNIVFNYGHFLIHGTRYMENLSVGPLYRTLLGNNNMIEFFGGYTLKNYFSDPVNFEEDRDSDGNTAYVSWVYLFMKDAFFNLKYEASRNRTDGINWNNTTYNLSANSIIPVIDRVKFQLSGNIFTQDFHNTHTVFGVERRDRTYMTSFDFALDLCKNTTGVIQYTGTQCNSNIPIYDYKRHLYTLGIEYRF